MTFLNDDDHSGLYYTGFAKMVKSESIVTETKGSNEKRFLGLGLDLGTTSLCAAVVDRRQDQLVEVHEQANDSNIKSPRAYESLQDADALVSQAISLIDRVISRYPDLKVIGVTGQMHGIVYVNAKGEAVSPLATWQDKRGDLNYQDGLSYCQYLALKTKYPAAAGFGLVTHFYNLVHHQIPEKARTIVTIMDYLTMKLAGRTTPLSHNSNAASLGCFNLDTGSFDAASLRNVSIDRDWLPAVTDQYELLGDYRGVPVSVAIGDNQASFLGAVSEPEASILVNIGTGSQLSVMTNSPVDCGLEARPYIRNKYLMVGSSLCGGRAYAVMERFFRSIAVSAGAPDKPLYTLMNQLASQAFAQHHKPGQHDKEKQDNRGNHTDEFEMSDQKKESKQNEMSGLADQDSKASQVNETSQTIPTGHFDPQDQLVMSTLFCGTRANPAVRGSIQQISDQNLTPENVVYGTLCGLAQELFQFYQDVEPFLEPKPRYVVASGNAVRKNKVLRQILGKTFGMTVRLPDYLEEASCGAALFALTCLEHFSNNT